MLSSHRSSFGQVYVHGETLYMRMVSTFFFERMAKDLLSFY